MHRSRRQIRDLPRNIKFRQPHVIVSLNDDQKVAVALSLYYLNVRFLINKSIPVEDYVVSQGVDALALTEMWFQTDTEV